MPPIRFVRQGAVRQRGNADAGDLKSGLREADVERGNVAFVGCAALWPRPPRDTHVGSARRTDRDNPFVRAVRPLDLAQHDGQSPRSGELIQGDESACGLGDSLECDDFAISSLPPLANCRECRRSRRRRRPASVGPCCPRRCRRTIHGCDIHCRACCRLARP